MSFGYNVLGFGSLGGSRITTITLNITSNASEYNILTAANSAGYDAPSGQPIVVNVASGVTVSGSSTHAMRTGAINAASPLTINVTGNIDGYTGANGSAGRPGGNGSVGGDAIYWESSTPYTGTGIVNILSGGKVRGGGGGGGGGGLGQVRQGVGPDDKGNPLCGAAPNITGSTGSTGSAGGFGAAGASGGTGGAASGSCPQVTAASGGGSGGAAGFAVRKNSRTVTVNNSGTMNGSAG
tara:strand:+ start:1160 stop:1876 length:717 start_codon:yes stop_codon:yes gene_type:complete